MGSSDISTEIFITYPPVVEDDLYLEVIHGLQKESKTLPSKLFYDQRGSLLFDQICKLEEYYPTRTEQTIMENNIHQIVGLAGPKCTLIEYGSGSSLKTKLLLDNLNRLVAYIPVDISREHLYNTVEDLNRCYPDIVIIPLWADFTKAFKLPLENDLGDRKLAYFPGSTIGNLHPQDAIVFMSNVAGLVGPGGCFLIGIDLVKDIDVLNLAYNDGKGITAAFNLNMLTHINRKFKADFDVSQFEHLAFYNRQAQRIEMHLISKVDQIVNIKDSHYLLYQGEHILTEVSYKYTLDGFASMAEQAGFKVRSSWVDPNNYFSVQYLETE